jgi:hypothetical protein
MNITFWKDNRLDREYKISVDTLVNDFIKSKYNQDEWLEYPFERRLNSFLMENNYGVYEPFTKKLWNYIYETCRLYINVIKTK